MSYISDFANNLRQRIQERQQKKREEQEFVRKLQIEAEAQRRMAFEEEYKKNVKFVAIAKAKQDAARLSGLQKLRALERTKRLEEGHNAPGSFFDKLSEYTQKNLARREENLKRTQEMRDAAKQMKEQRLIEQQRARMERTNQFRKPFGVG